MKNIIETLWMKYKGGTALKNTFLRRIICFFFSFILSLSFFIISASFIFRGTVLNKEFLLEELSLSGYHINASNYTKDKISQLAFAGGLPADIFDGIITSEGVKNDVYNIFEHAYRGTQYSVDRGTLYQEFLETVKNYALENSIEITEETENGITHLALLCTEAYTDCINISMINMVIGALKQPVLLMGYAAAGAFLTALISTIMLLLVNRYKHKFLRYIAGSAGGCFLLLSAVPGYLLLNRPYENLNISPDYLHEFICSVFSDTLKTFLGTAALFAVFYIIVFILIGHYKKRAVKKGIRERRRTNLP